MGPRRKLRSSNYFIIIGAKLFCMKKLLIATHNRAKAEYFAELLKFFKDIKILTLDDFDINDTPVENGKTEVANALIKARYYSKKSNQVCFSDDVGMYINALKGEPGLEVRRWNGKFDDDVDDKVWLDYFLERLNKSNSNDRQGHLLIGRAVVSPLGKEFNFNWRRDFIVRDKPNWDNYKKGWPMSALYTELKFNKPWSKFSLEEKLEYEKDNLIKFNNIFKDIWN